MKFRFMHIADVHLGYQQYGLSERADDFYDAFIWAIDEAIRHKVDFVLLAGDLFHKRSIGALTLNQAFRGLTRLHEANIPCIAVEGNHELAYYDEPVGWLQFLAIQGLLVLLAPEVEGGAMRLSAWSKRRGSWFDPLGGVRIHGMKYAGAGATAAIRQYAAALADHDASGCHYTIFMAHTGVQGVLDTDHGSPSSHEWRALDKYAHYIALGHIHKPFDFDNRIYNPGSLESNSVAEYEWTGRGYLLVDVDTDDRERLHSVTRVETPKREFLRTVVKVDRCDSQHALLAECNKSFARLVRDRTASVDSKQPGKQPIVEIILTGNLPFDAAALDLREIASAATSAIDALHVMVKNATDKFQVRTEGLDEEGISRPQLEQLVISSLFAGDARYSDNPAAWASATVQIKNLAVAKTPAAAVLDEVEASVTRIESSA